MAICAPAPAPDAIARGRTPKPKASEVMTMGRSRVLAASIVASIRFIPFSRFCTANWTIRMAFLVVRPRTVRRPIWK